MHKPGYADQIVRTDYVWMKRSSAATLIDMIDEGWIDLDWVGKLARAIEESARTAEEWRSPEDIAAPLRKFGIIAAGESAVSYSAVRRQQGPGDVVGDALLKLGFAVAGRVAGLSTLMKLARVGFAIGSVKLAVTGYLINDGKRPLKLPMGNIRPYYDNVADAVGPMALELPARQQIVDPMTGEDEECVPFQPLMITNAFKLEDCYGALLAEQDDGSRIGIAFGAAKGRSKKDPASASSTIVATGHDDASKFYSDWIRSNGDDAPDQTSKSALGSSTIRFDMDSKLTNRTYHLGVVYRGN